MLHPLRIALALALSLICVTVHAEEFLDFRVNSSLHHVGMYLNGDDGKALGSFGALEQYLKQKGVQLVFAMNGGIFMTDQRPLGLYIENGKELRPLSQRTQGYGNFYMQPNGVFAITEVGPFVVSTKDYPRLAQDHRVSYATQSGPLVVIDGDINPEFDTNSPSRKVRNGVCVDRQAIVHFSISQSRVTFYEMASHFRDDLKCQNALYLDGSISAVYYPERGFDSLGGYFGPMIGVTLK